MEFWKFLSVYVLLMQIVTKRGSLGRLIDYCMLKVHVANISCIIGTVRTNKTIYIINNKKKESGGMGHKENDFLKATGKRECWVGAEIEPPVAARENLILSDSHGRNFLLEWSMAILKHGAHLWYAPGLSPLWPRYPGAFIAESIPLSDTRRRTWLLSGSSHLPWVNT